MSVGSRINEIMYADGSGSMQLQTRRTPYLHNNASDPVGLRTNVFMTPTGQVVFGAESQANGPKLHKEDGLVVNGNMRLIPTTLPACNDINRGLFAVQEIGVDCGIEGGCSHDALFVCVKLQDYVWQQLTEFYSDFSEQK